MLGMPVILSVSHSISFWEGFSYTKNNGYLDDIMGVSGVFHPKKQFNVEVLSSMRAPTWLYAQQPCGALWIKPDERNPPVKLLRSSMGIVRGTLGRNTDTRA